MLKNTKDAKDAPKKSIEISKSGAWNGTFPHMVDQSFGTALVSLLKERKITSITDFGCGSGGYIKMISEARIFARGFDGNPNTEELDVSGGLCIGPVDLTQERTWNVTDAAMSIEVAEHIPAQFEDVFVSNLASSARDLIILSWGVPGQKGTGHVNGKTAMAVEQKMKEHGWAKDKEPTRKLQTAATFRWIRRNVQVFSKTA